MPIRFEVAGTGSGTISTTLPRPMGIFSSLVSGPVRILRPRRSNRIGTCLPSSWLTARTSSISLARSSGDAMCGIDAHHVRPGDHELSQPVASGDRGTEGGNDLHMSVTCQSNALTSRKRADSRSWSGSKRAG